MEKIAVIIPFFNDNINLIKSIKSIKEDCISFSLDLVLINDGGKQNIDPKLLCFYNYGEIYYLSYKKNKGVSFARNYGLEFALKNNYKYIAFLDAGDFCKQNRFLIQYNYLNKNEDIKLLGTQVEFVDEDNKILYKTNLPTDYKKIKRHFYLNIQIYQPSAMMRTDIIEKIGLYPTHYKISTDYGYFFKIVNQFKVSNIDKVLVSCIAYKKGISSTKRKEQVRTRIKVSLKYFYFGFYPIYGLLRNILLLLVSRNFSDKVKRLIYK